MVWTHKTFILAVTKKHLTGLKMRSSYNFAILRPKCLRKINKIELFNSPYILTSFDLSQIARHWKYVGHAKDDGCRFFLRVCIRIHLGRGLGLEGVRALNPFVCVLFVDLVRVAVACEGARGLWRQGHRAVLGQLAWEGRPLCGVSFALRCIRVGGGSVHGLRFEEGLWWQGQACVGALYILMQINWNCFLIAAVHKIHVLNIA